MTEVKFWWPRRFQMTGYCRKCGTLRMVKRPTPSVWFLGILAIATAFMLPLPITLGGVALSLPTPLPIMALGWWRKNRAACVDCNHKRITDKMGRDSESLVWDFVWVAGMVWIFAG